MKIALRLARRGLGNANPNPMVGAVLVRRGAVVGKGYHRLFGGNHAEVNAIEDAGGDVSGATLYATLEPCCHYRKKTPPCVNAIVGHEIARVVVATLDPNPLVNGRGIEFLNQHGIQTRVGVLEEECRALNEAYFKFMTTGLPFVTLKFAETLDGRIATVTGDSQWISSESARKLAHRLRSMNDAILVGLGTILADNPQLTVRLVRGRNPIRIIPDSTLRIPLDARVLKDQDVAPTIIVTTARADEKKLSALETMGIEVIRVYEDERGEVDLEDLLRRLAEKGISSVLVEGGAGIITSLLYRRLVDKIMVVVAPKIMGRGIEAVGDLRVRGISETLNLSFLRVRRAGGDFVIEARVENSEG